MSAKAKKRLHITEGEITSSEWEYIDPTPDIHALFFQFDQRFFGGRLQGVEVKWSKRMKLCAGVCSYEGRGGLCSVRLSEPLLKLRPRKDLVETLLHEMIHAFLFVTQNNRDRDGHGPEFQKHMHRINNECGCNITIYHSFHAEVRLYQQHVWRCNGPCTTRRPFFGLVRRSMNRAPGPNDNWWAEHLATCGGTFTKIQEPEKLPQKTTKAKTSKVPDNQGGDIRKFVKTVGDPVNGVKPSTSGLPSFKNVRTGEKINGEQSSSVLPVNKGIAPTAKVKTFGDVTQGTTSGLPVNRGTGSLSNVSGFSNFISGRGGSTGGGVMRGAVANRGSKTLVLPGGRKTDPAATAPPQSEFVPFQGRGNVLGSSSGSSSAHPYRNTALPTKSTNTTPKKSKGESKLKSPNRLITSYMTQPTNSDNLTDSVILLDTPPKKPRTSEDIVNCPVCNVSMSVAKVDAHLDSCLPVSPAKVIVIDDDEEEVAGKEEDLAKCPLCDGYYASDKLAAHVNSCVETLHDAFVAAEVLESQETQTEKAQEKQTEVPENVSCPICAAEFSEQDINKHIDSCLSESAIRGGDFA